MYLLQHVRREVGCQRIITRQHCASGWRATNLVSEFSSFPPSLLSLFLLIHLSLFLSFCLSPCTSRWQSGGLRCMSTCECEVKSRAGGPLVGLFMCRGEHVATGLNASRGPWQTTGPPVLSALCLDKGPPILLSKGPQALTAKSQAGVIIWTGRRTHAQPSPQLPAYVLRLQTHQLSNINIQSHLKCNKRVIVYLLQTLLLCKALMKMLSNCSRPLGLPEWVKCEENNPFGWNPPQISHLLLCYL